MLPNDSVSARDKHSLADSDVFRKHKSHLEYFEEMQTHFHTLFLGEITREELFLADCRVLTNALALQDDKADVYGNALCLK